MINLFNQTRMSILDRQCEKLFDSSVQRHERWQENMEQRLQVVLTSISEEY